MTKVELVNRIMEVTTAHRGVRATLMDCVDAYSETLLLRIRSQVEVALEKAVTVGIDDLRHQGRGEQASDCSRCDDGANRRRSGR